MGSRAMPGFSVAVVRDGELAGRLRALHRAVLGEEPELRREEALLLAWGLLLPGYAGMVETVSACRVEVERTCAFIRSHYARHITLEELSLQAGLSKSALGLGKGRHALPLSDGGADQRGTAPAGTGCLLCRGRRGDRLFRSEPFHQLFHCLHRPDAGGLPGAVPAGMGERMTQPWRRILHGATWRPC